MPSAAHWLPLQSSQVSQEQKQKLPPHCRATLSWEAPVPEDSGCRTAAAAQPGAVGRRGSCRADTQPADAFTKGWWPWQEEKLPLLPISHSSTSPSQGTRMLFSFAHEMIESCRSTKTLKIHRVFLPNCKIFMSEIVLDFLGFP